MLSVKENRNCMQLFRGEENPNQIENQIEPNRKMQYDSD